MGVLDDIISGVREDLAEREQRLPRAELERIVAASPAPRDAMSTLAGDDLAVIAEVKRASPSKGALAEIADPAELAAAYAAGGAAAISVLTEKRRFNGTLADLDAVRARVDTPVLRKDFMVTEYQLLEARAHGADLALLIVAALTDAELAHLHQFTLELGLTPLVEVHTVDEAHRAAAIGARLIGVNNRNLHTLEVDIAQFALVSAALPADTVTVAESGLSGPADVARVRAEGADVVLVGEALVTHNDPQTAVAAMLAAAQENHV